MMDFQTILEAIRTLLLNTSFRYGKSERCPLLNHSY